MKIKIYSDYVCPFCYLEKEALKQALNGMEAEIEFIPYELRRPPIEPVDPLHDEMRLKRFEEVIKPDANTLGLEMNLPNLSPHPYTTLAFQGFYYAKSYGKDADYNTKIFHTFYVDEQDIGQQSVIESILIDLELCVEEFRNVLKEKTYMPILDELYHNKKDLPFKGIPSMYVNDRFINGYHSVEDLKKIIFDEAVIESQGMSCGIDGCK